MVERELLAEIARLRDSVTLLAGFVGFAVTHLAAELGEQAADRLDQVITKFDGAAAKLSPGGAEMMASLREGADLLRATTRRRGVAVRPQDKAKPEPSEGEP